MAIIKSIVAREILDSRGNPTVEVDVLSDSNVLGRAAVPSGASTGEREAVELRDGDPKRYAGKGVQKAVHHVATVLAPALIGTKLDDQRAIDDKIIALDGSPNKSRLGANALLGVSLAAAKARALCAGRDFFAELGKGEGCVLPVPLMNVVNGGAHADNGLDIQEFMIVPHGAPRFCEALRWGVEIFHTLKALLKKRGLSTAVGDEGGFAPRVSSAEEVLSLLCEAIEKAGYAPGKDVGLALDVAASEFYDRAQGGYQLKGLGLLSSAALADFYETLIKQFPIVSIEDPFDQNDWAGFAHLNARLGARLQIVGDDLFVTNEKLLKRGIDEHVANAILIKPNQIGTLTETLDTIALAKKAKYGVILSHRSGETEDASIADIAVATNAGQIKTGSLSRSDRLAKYNQLLRIEEKLGDKALFLGW